MCRRPFTGRAHCASGPANAAPQRVGTPCLRRAAIWTACHRLSSELCLRYRKADVALCVRHVATSHARCASSRAQGICYCAKLRRTCDDGNSLCVLVRPWLAARGDDQRCGRAANDWMRCATGPAHAAPRYESTLCVNQAATGCALQAAERPSPCYRTQRPSIRVPPRAAGPAGYASPTAHRACYRARAHGICAEPHRFCAEGRSSGTAMLYRTSCCPLRVPRRSWPCTLRP